MTTPTFAIAPAPTTAGGVSSATFAVAPAAPSETLDYRWCSGPSVRAQLTKRGLAGLSDADVARACVFASELLGWLSDSRFHLPVLQDWQLVSPPVQPGAIPGAWSGADSWADWLSSGAYGGGGFGGNGLGILDGGLVGGLGFGAAAWLPLPGPDPVQTITIGGVPYLGDVAQEGSLLVRLDGTPWPPAVTGGYQYGAGATQVRVTQIEGRVPAAGRYAAEALAVELAYGLSSTTASAGVATLQQRVTQKVQQGVTLSFADMTTLVKDRLTGVTAADEFLIAARSRPGSAHAVIATGGFWGTHRWVPVGPSRPYTA